MHEEEFVHAAYRLMREKLQVQGLAVRHAPRFLLWGKYSRPLPVFGRLFRYKLRNKNSPFQRQRRSVVKLLHLWVQSMAEPTRS